MYNLFRYKVVIPLVFVLSVFQGKVGAQTKNLELFDQLRWIHFGFSLGTNFSNFKYQLSDTFYLLDTLNSVDIHKTPGITLGAISDLHIGQYFDLRLIPSLVITQRTITYNFADGSSTDKNIESIFAEIPLMLKFKSVRHGNIRFYVIGGGKAGYDFSSDSKSSRDPNDPFVAITPWNYSYEFGCGLDLYFELFKFSPEIKISNGINNVLDPFNDIYSGSFRKMFSNFIYISFHFEG